MHVIGRQKSCYCFNFTLLILIVPYDHCFWSVDEEHELFADQTKIYEAIGAPLLDKAINGYNTCLFAYGQTGSGKSYR